MRREALIVARALARLRRPDYVARGVWAYKPNDHFTSGIPDILVCARGRFIAIEVKDPKGGKPKPIQVYTLGQIERAGGIAAVATTAVGIVGYVEEVLRKIEAEAS